MVPRIIVSLADQLLTFMDTDYGLGGITRMLASQQHRWNDFGLGNFSTIIKMVQRQENNLSPFLKLQQAAKAPFYRFEKGSAVGMLLAQNSVMNAWGINSGVNKLGSALALQHKMIAAPFQALVDRQLNSLSKLNLLNTTGFVPSQYQQLGIMRNLMQAFSATIAWSDLSGLTTEEETAELGQLADSATTVATDAVNVDEVGQSALAEIKAIVLAIKRDPKASIGFYIGLIGFLFSILQFVWDKAVQHQAAPDPVILEQLQGLRTELNEIYRAQEMSRWFRRKAVKTCAIYAQPRSGAIAFGKVSSGTTVEVQNVRKKWLLITYLDQDSLPVTGWVLKKYFKPLK